MELAKYWVIRGRLMAGAYPASRDPHRSVARLEGLVVGGLRMFLDLTEPEEPTGVGPLRSYEGDLSAVEANSGAQVWYKRFPIPDLGVPDARLMTEILDTLDAVLEAGAPAYLHCLGGRGRTGVVVGCYLVRHADQLLGTEDARAAGALALRRIVSLRTAQGVPFAQDSPQTRQQKEMVLGWRPGR